MELKTTKRSPIREGWIYSYTHETTTARSGVTRGGGQNKISAVKVWKFFECNKEKMKNWLECIEKLTGMSRKIDCNGFKQSIFLGVGDLVIMGWLALKIYGPRWAHPKILFWLHYCLKVISILKVGIHFSSFHVSILHFVILSFFLAFCMFLLNFR